MPTDRPAAHRLGARTPEELNTLLEDALIVSDPAGVEPLYESDAVLLTGDAPLEARGSTAIATVLTELHDRSYVATPGLVLRSRDLALTIGAGVHVLRRGPDRSWRYALSVMDVSRPGDD